MQLACLYLVFLTLIGWAADALIHLGAGGYAATVATALLIIVIALLTHIEPPIRLIRRIPSATLFGDVGFVFALCAVASVSQTLGVTACACATLYLKLMLRHQKAPDTASIAETVAFGSLLFGATAPFRMVGADSILVVMTVLASFALAGLAELSELRLGRDAKNAA